MSRQRNQNDGNLKDILRRLYRLERQSPLAHSAIGREGLEVYDGGWIRILNGGLQVIGTATISGTLDVTGTFNASGTNTLSGTNHLTGPTDVTGNLSIEGTTTISGDTSITGQLDVTGPTNLDGLLTINGDTTITGLLDITGDTTVDGNFEILGNGLFKAGETQIEPTGKATFGDVIIDPASIWLIQTPGGWISGTGADDITLASTNSGSVSMNSTHTVLDFKGQKLTMTEPDTIISNRLTVNGSIETKQNLVVGGPTVILKNLPPTNQPANLYINASGYLYRSTAT